MPAFPPEHVAREGTDRGCDRTMKAGDIERFRHAAEGAGSLPDLKALFAATLKPFGVTGFAVGHIAGGGRPITMFMATWPPALMELYAMGGFIGDDPAVSWTKAESAPLRWHSRPGGSFEDHRVLAAFQQFGYEEGLVVPVHGPGDARGCAALLALHLDLSPPLEANVVEMSRQCYRVARRLADRQAGRMTLPPRERAALTLVAQGFEDAAIGAALGITRVSAHVYVERAKRRLGARSRAQAVAIALADGLI